MLIRQRQIKKHRGVRAGYTLMEMLVVVAIIVVLAGIGSIYLLPKLDESKEKIDYATTKQLSEACKMYKLNNGDFPPSLDALAQTQPNGDKPVVEPSLLEPKVGGQFRYDPAGPHNNGLNVDIWVDGPNGQIGNWMRK
jgi:general secretion pathway protein G